MNKNTVEIWRGPSRIDGAEIVVLAVGLKGSKNVKTGDMIQTYILRADMSPMDAIVGAWDVSICGSCPHRNVRGGHKGRSCYVNVGQGPNGVWKSWNRGNVQAVDPGLAGKLVEGRMVRLGTYGDPAAVPLQVWSDLVQFAAGWTGYTHQANRPDLQDTLALCQLSADSLADAETARSAGIGSFRVLGPEDSIQTWEVACPASKEAGFKAVCADCGMCSGADGQNVAIRAHGTGKGNVAPVKPRYNRGISLPVLS